MQPIVSIIIVHFRKPEMLELCLDSVKKATVGLNAEIIVIDSASLPQQKQIMRRRYPEIRFLPFVENLGYSRGVNIGLKAATGQYLLVLNPDIIVSDNAIGDMLTFIQQHPDIGMLGPQLRNFNNSYQRSYFRFYTPLTILARRTPLGHLRYFKKINSDFLMLDTDPSDIQTPDWIMGSAMLISRPTYEKVGGMDERFFMYFEDVDWCRRIWHAGYKVVYYPKAILYHYLGRGSASRLGVFDALFNKRTHWHMSSALKFFLKYRNLAHLS